MNLSPTIVNVGYLVAAVLFILDLKWMTHPKTAVRGNRAGTLAMFIAVFVTLTGFNLFGQGLRDAMDPRLRH